MFYVYVLKSLKDEKLYTGQTGELNKRIEEHNSGKQKSTRNRKPFKLIYFEKCLTRSQAIKRESQLKTGFGRKFLKSLLQKSNDTGRGVVG
ncbi:GIY-YIG nuclease family protein [Elusimicrobiota bacterium]